jgi:predicted RNA-binding Zn-ribbon protein involved in translation (DUF1610 family)
MKIQKDKPKNDIIIISGEDDRPVFLCNYCGRTLVKLSDSKGASESYYCKHCSIEILDSEDIRKKSKLVTPKDRNNEALVSTTPMVDYQAVEIRKEVEIKGGLAELKKSGLKIKSYNEGVG